MSVATGPHQLQAGTDTELLQPPGGIYAAVALVNISPLPLLLFGNQDWLGPWQSNIYGTLDTRGPIVVTPDASTGSGQLLATWFAPDEAARVTRWTPPTNIPFPTGYQTVQDEGTALAQETILDFAGAGVTATDDAAGHRTLVTIPGGGSTYTPPTDRAQYFQSAAHPTINNNDTIWWNPNPFVSSGRQLLDFTDIQNPTVLVAGTYAIGCDFEVTAVAGKRFSIQLALDANNEDPEFWANDDMDNFPTSKGNPHITAVGTYYLPVGAVIWVQVFNDIALPGTMTYGALLYVQLLS